MKCDSCSVDIPPAWVKVISSNICPECNGPIMADDTIELMSGLKSALEQMPNDPQGIAGWLLSHYRMQKVGTGEPTGFHGIKKSSKNNSPEDRDNLKIADNPMQKFLKNAGIDPAKQSNYALLAAQINAGEADKDFSDLEVQETNDDYVAENEDPEFTKQALRTMIGPQNGKRQMKKHVEPNFDEGLEDLPHPLLAGDRMKRLTAQKDLAFGGSVGKIRRSDQ